MVIRNVAAKDWQSIEALEKGYYDTASYSPYFIRMIPEILSRYTYVIEDYGIQGYILNALSSNEKDCAWVVSLLVARDYRRRGAARRLLQLTLTEFENRVRYIKLTVEENNDAAIQLYESTGFRINGLCKDFFGEGKDRLLMTYHYS